MDAFLGPATPLSLASADFDGDGIRDLTVGLGTSTGGALAIHRGNIDAFAPQGDASLRAIERGEFASTYLPDAQLVPLPSRPDLLAAGDFIGEDGPGVVAAARGSHTLHVVANGESGRMELLQSIDLGGAITAIGAHQMQPGKYSQVIVGVHTDNGSELRIFTGSHDGLTESSRTTLTGDATAFAFGDLDGDSLPDVLVVAGGEVSIVHSNGQTTEHVRLPYQTKSAALGTFVSDRDPILSMALLATDGSLHIVAQSQRDSRPFTLEEHRARRKANLSRQMAPFPRQRKREWKEAESYSNVANVSDGGSAPLMLRTRVSSNALDDVMLLDATRLTVLAHPDSSMDSGLIVNRNDLGADAVAAIAERTNIDGRLGVVYLKKGALALFTITPFVATTFTVNRADDPTPTSPITSACNGGASSCSLREAILRSNANAGTDTVSIPAGAYTLTRARIAGDYSSNQGTLDVTDSVNIVGAGMATTSIHSTVDKPFSFNQDISAFTAATVTISGVTIQNSTNQGDTSATDGWGGAFDFDTGTSGTANLTVTSCNITGNSLHDGEGGGFAVFNSNQGSGGVTVIASIIQSNTAHRSASIDPNGAGNGGGIAVLWPAKLTMTNTKVMNNIATQLGTGAGVGGGIAIFGGGGVANLVTLHGGVISGNTAPGNGGGVYSTAGLTIDLGAVISGNTSSGNGGGIWFAGDPGDPATLSKITITGNAANSGVGGGIYVGSAGQPLSIGFSRLANNTASTAASKNLVNQTSGGSGSAVTAQNNWWGTNTPSGVITPSTSTCAAGAFQVCFSPWLKLNFTAGTSPILVGGNSTLTASFLLDSNGGAVSASNLNVMAGVPITFNNNVNGTLSNAQSAIQNVQSVSGATESGTTVTITTSANHGFSNGQTVTISGVGLGYDGVYTVGGASLNTFTYTAPVSGLGSLGAGGTASVPVGTATVLFTGNHVGLGAADAVIDGFTLTLPVKVVVNDNTTTTAVNQTATYNDSSQNVTLTANMASSSGCCTVAGGTVTFTVKNGGSTIGVPVTSGTVAGGTVSATFVLPGGTNAGTYTIQAVYSGTSTGTGDFLTSSDLSGTHTLIVNQAPSTTAASSTTAVFNPGDQTVPLSATVTSVDGTVNAGTVTFTVFDGGSNQVGSPVTSGTVAAGAASANFTLPGGSPIGTYSIHASYSGSTNFLTSSDNTHTLTVNANTTTTAANATATFSTSSQTVSLSATVTSNGGTVNAGTVTFGVFNGATQIGSSVTSGTVSGGAASANYTLPASTGVAVYSIHATYNAGGNFLTSSDATHSLTVNQATTTTTAANASASFNASSQTVALSATVTSPSGTVGSGTVTFGVFNGATQIGSSVTSGTVAGGNASANYTLPGGTGSGVYTIQASYNGTTNLATSSDNTHTLTVSAGTTTTASNATATFSASGQPVTLSATVTSTGGTVNAGTVTFGVFNGATQIGSSAISGTVSGGAASASFTLPGGTAVGVYSIHASYSGGGTFGASSDNTHTLTVNKATPVITWNNPADITFGSALSSVQLNAAANTPGSFVYTPAAGTVLPVGNGQTLSVQFTPTDTADYNNASKNVLINVLPASGPATLVMTQTLARDTGTNEVVVTVTLANTGGTAATGVQALTGKIGATPTTTALPAAMADIPGGGSSSIVLRFPGSVGIAGTRPVFSFTASSSAGQFTGSARVTLP